MDSEQDAPTSWLDRPILGNVRITFEAVLFVGILIIALVSRFYLLEPRVMSHDETIHTYHNSWSLFRGTGYLHDPLSHGPLQFHLIALSYFLFGDNDLTARIPAVLFSIATVAMAWNYRRYLGRAGALVAAAMFLISPYILYYGRYVRNESLAAFFGVVMLWSMLRYLETGKDRYTYWFTASVVLHFTAKETSFIYAAQALIFLAILFVYRVLQKPWRRPQWRNYFLIALIVALLLLAGLGVYTYVNRGAISLSSTQTSAPPVPGQELAPVTPHGLSTITLILIVLGGVALITAVYFLVFGYSWQALRSDRAFGMLILLGTLVLPQLSALPVYLVGWNIPVNATEVRALQNIDIVHIAIFLVPMFLLSIVLGLLWNRRLWLINAAIWYALFTVFYTTLFTNGPGFFTGMVGSLGYWLEQQGVERGSQPIYYYILVQIPIYEYLSALASLITFGLVLFGVKLPKADPTWVPTNDNLPAEEIEKPPVVALLGFWAVISIFAFTFAGEKMPWLTVHLTWPMILFGSLGIGYLIDSIDWGVFRTKRGWLILVLLPIVVISFSMMIGSLLGSNPPFAGKELQQLEATNTFLFALIGFLASCIGMFFLISSWPISQLIRVFTLFIFLFFGILTARTAYQASYINYDNANELLVYAHSAGGVKVIMDQVEEISRRTTDGLSLPIAYDGEYPFPWYLRNYTNVNFFGSNPTRSLRDYKAIIVGQDNFGKIEPVVGQGYYQYEYIRLWWPNQDYFNITWARIWEAIKNPQMREALFQIWLNRDYTQYGKVKGIDMSLTHWNPSERVRLYIRKDVLSDIWNYGIAPTTEQLEIDPWEGKQTQLLADKMFGMPGSQPGQFNRPRDLAIAPDGSLYIADTDNHRIQHLTSEGGLINTWGSFGDVAQGAALGGVFNQPWGIGIGPDGSVFVADTWNHRIQKFSTDGEFIKMWGYFGQAEKPDAFWGPRDIDVDAEGRVFVTDTGNKRIVVFDSDGNYLTQFGEVGMEAGQFDEPVGVTVADDGRVFVADTWNQRIQVFQELEEGGYQPAGSWDVASWYGQSLDNKPFLSIDKDGRIFASDPEGYRVLQFSDQGEKIRYWGAFGNGADTFGLAGSVASDDQGGVWVTDTGNGRIMYFQVP